MFFTLKKQFPEVDLTTLSKDDILKNEYPVRTVVESMKSGMLQDILEAGMLTGKF
jgi:hypothetical protein